MAENRLIKSRAIGIFPSKAKTAIVLVTRNEDQPRWVIDAYERYDLDGRDKVSTHLSAKEAFGDHNRSKIVIPENRNIPIVMVKRSPLNVPITIFFEGAGFRVFLPASVQFGSPTQVNEDYVASNDKFWEVFPDMAKELVDARFLEKAREFKPEPGDYYVPSKPRIFDDIKIAVNAAMNYLTMMADDIPAMEYRPIMFGTNPE